MTALRHRLRWCVAAWLIVQVAALSAFVPQDCCATHKNEHRQARHRPPATASAHSHHSMDHASMHGSTQDVSSATDATPMKTCVMKGTCKGPMSAMIAVLSSHGVSPIGAFRIAPDLTSSLAAAIARQHATSRLVAPDTPPPRA
jgi:hypothetical protein